MTLALALPIFTIIIIVITFLVAGRVVTWSWNTFMVPILDAKPLNEQQGLALFTLVFMLLGFWRL